MSVEQPWSGSLLAAPETHRGIGFPPGMVMFASAWQPEATEGGETQVRLQILQSPVDPRQAERSLGHHTDLKVYF